MGVGQSRPASGNAASPNPSSLSGSRPSQRVRPSRTEPTPAAPPPLDPPPASPHRPSDPHRSPLSYFLPMGTPDTAHEHYFPSPGDIRLTAAYLARKGLPVEVAHRILDHAEYWSACRRMCAREVTVTAGSQSPRLRSMVSSAFTNGQEHDLVGDADDRNGWDVLREGDGEVWVLASEPVGCTATPQRLFPSAPFASAPSSGLAVAAGTAKDGADATSPRCNPVVKRWLRRVVIETLSRDQGWSTNGSQYYGTYEQSYSWFEASLFRNGEEVEGTRTTIQYNVHAGQYYRMHQNVLELDHPLVRDAQAGDRIILWARAKYPGWRNLVRETAMTMFTAPFPPQA